MYTVQCKREDSDWRLYSDTVDSMVLAKSYFAEAVESGRYVAVRIVSPHVHKEWEQV